MNGDNKKDWYNNKDLFEMMQVIGEKMNELDLRLSETIIKIRDYNGLREEFKLYRDEVLEIKATLGSIIAEQQGKEQGTKDARLIIFNIITAVLLASSLIVSLVLRYSK